jgi:hypothetical protein
MQKEIQTETQEETGTAHDDISVPLMVRGYGGVVRFEANLVRTFSPSPTGAARTPGLIPVDLSGIIPREAEAPADSLHVGGCPDLPKNQRPSGTEEEGALGSTSIFQRISSPGRRGISENS